MKKTAILAASERNPGAQIGAYELSFEALDPRFFEAGDRIIKLNRHLPPVIVPLFILSGLELRATPRMDTIHRSTRTGMKKTFCLLARASIATLLVLCVDTLPAAEAPKSPERLREAASHIVTGEVTRIESHPESSKIEAGGFDYAIQCSIAVDRVEKGEGIKPGDQLVAHCFRPKARLSLLQSFSLQGHEPVPAAGQRVRAYLVARGGMYHAIHPNGFTPRDSGRLSQADQVAQGSRWSTAFTFLLPIELWLLIVIGALPAAVVAIKTRKPPLRKVLKLILAVPAALGTAGMVVGFLGFLEATNNDPSGVLRSSVIVFAVSAIGGCGALTVWLCVTALRSNARE